MWVAAGTHKLCCNNGPELAPHQTYAAHVVVCALHHLLKAEQPRPTSLCTHSRAADKRDNIGFTASTGRPEPADSAATL